MSAKPTWAPDPQQAPALARAGWSADDLDWERTSERAAEADLRGEAGVAVELWAAALRLARRGFAGNDPRLAASLTNQAVALARSGRRRVADQLFEEALLVWDAVPAWVLAMRLEAPARSSLFHLRLELRHGEAYARRQREACMALAREGREATLAHARGRSPTAADPTRWRSEQPEGFTDRRKLLAAARLIAPRPVAAQEGVVRS